jgi:Uma2 family endonuclease
MVNLDRRPFSVDDFHEMAKLGLLSAEERVELIEGEIVNMSPIGSRHAGCVNALTRLFAPLMLRRAAVISIQGPLRLNPRTEVYPDVQLLRPREDDYRHQLPGPEDVLLVIEVSDTTLDYDREVKLPLYAQAGVPEVWIVDLMGERILVHREPSAAEYSFRTLRRGGSVRLERFADVELRVDEVLG